MTDDQKKQFNDLLSDYEVKTNFREQKEKEMEEAKVEQSKVVEALSDLIQPAKRLRYKGEEYSIVRRGNNFFFRGAKGEIVG